MNWKKLSQQISESHRENGGTMITESGEFPAKGVCLNLTDEDKMLVKNGPDLHPKEIRKWLWNNRQTRALSRDSFIVWTAYDLDEHTSFLGVGSIVSPDVSSRFPEQHKVLIS